MTADSTCKSRGSTATGEDSHSLNELEKRTENGSTGSRVLKANSYLADG